MSTEATKSSLVGPWARASLATLAGALVGFLYYRFVGCRTGTCMISSNPYVATAYGAFVGLLLGKPRRAPVRGSGAP